MRGEGGVSRITEQKNFSGALHPHFFKYFSLYGDASRNYTLTAVKGRLKLS